MESFNLNIIPGKAWPVCHASQYDIGRTIRINLFEGGTVYTLDGAETISLSVRKPDGNVVTASVTNTSDSYVEIETTEQMTAVHGSNVCELKIEEGGDVIGTMNFILEVEQDPLEGGIESQSEIDNLETQVSDMVTTALADQYDSGNVLFDAAPTAGHGVPYTVTSEGIKAALDTKAEIDDVTPSDSTVYSSDKVNDLLAFKQNITDSNLQTTADTIVGAINEVNSAINDFTYQTLTHSASGTKFYFAKNGNIGQISIDEQSQVTLPTSWTSIGNIGSSFYKSGTGFWIIPCLIVDKHQIDIRINQSTGEVFIKADVGTAMWAQGRGLYLI